MYINSKAFFVIILMVLSIAAAVVFFNLKEAERANHIKLQEQLRQERSFKEKLREGLSVSKSDKKNLQDRLRGLKEEAKSLEAEVLENKRKTAAISKKIGALDKDISYAKEKIELASSNIPKLKKRRSKLLAAKSALDGKLKLLRKTRDALSKRLSGIAKDSGIPVPVKDLQKGLPETEAPKEPLLPVPEPGLRGEILTVNREFNFVVISLGRNDGLEEGAPLYVMRDSKALAQIKVETVRQTISAAEVFDKDRLAAIRPGDKVVSEQIR